MKLLWIAIVLSAVLDAAPGDKCSYSLQTDWSDTANPNSPWSYREGNNVLPQVGSLWPPIFAGNQPAWARIIGQFIFLPVWFKSAALSTDVGTDWQPGDVVMHSWDSVNGVGSGHGNVRWTSPRNTTIDISGSLWLARKIYGRSNQWALYLNNTLLTGGVLTSQDSFTRASPASISNGSGGPNAVRNLTVQVGDVVKLEIRNSSFSGEFAGVELIIRDVGTSCQAPVLSTATFFGGAGDQVGRAIGISGGRIHVGGDGGEFVRYAIPPLAPIDSTTSPGRGHTAIASAGTSLYSLGGARPPVCGAVDGVGDTESKSSLARYDTATGTLLNCQSTNHFPYRGGEGWSSGVPSGGFLYTNGTAETCGFGNHSFVLAKYDLNGNLVSKVAEPGVDFGGFTCIGGSTGTGIAALNGNLYVTGQSRLTGEDATARPVLMRYSPTLVRDWKRRPSDNNGGAFNAVITLGGSIFAAGYSGTGSTTDFLVEKYDEAGNRIWSRSSRGAGQDVINGLASIGNRLFGVGSTNSQGSGGADAVILEIDPSTGVTLSSTTHGGALDDSAYSAATDGTDLYIVGGSRSFATAGNSVGQSDIMLLRYTLTVTTPNRPPDAVDDTVNASTTGSTTIRVLDNDVDPDGDLLTIVGVTPPQYGRAVIEGPFVVFLPNASFGGRDYIRYTISDGKGGTDSANVVIARPLENRPPAVRPDSVFTPPNIQVQINVLANDSDPDNDPLTIAITQNPAHGSAVITNNSTQIRYTPAPGFAGTDQLRYQASDGRGGTGSATVSITVGTVDTCAANITNLVTVVQGPKSYPPAGGWISQLVQIRNTSSTPRPGPLTLVLDPPPGLLGKRPLLNNKTGETACAAPLQSHYIDVNIGADNVLSPGETATVNLSLVNPRFDPATVTEFFVPRVLGGPGGR